MEQNQDKTTLVTATETWLSVVRAYNECTATLAQRLEPIGVSVLQHEILMNLQLSPGITQQHLSQRCFSAKSGISMIVTKFVEAGIVQRCRASKDQRAWSLSLTQAGQDLAVKVAAEQAKVVLQMAQPYTAEELALVEARMDQSSERLKSMREGRLNTFS